ncbi:MAG: hypothetical protein HUJ26_02665 [Planctomycetaceae bacterium]|nr:hypothetical protein [Planctomycetaceae bacterium]
MMNSFNTFSLRFSPLLADVGSSPKLSHWTEQLGLALILLLGAAFIVQGIWNGLMAEFPQIGRISYFRAIHIASVLGLILFALLYLIF